MNFDKKKLLRIVVPILIGGVLGYSYYYFIGCRNGCPIQSNPLLSTLYGSALGAILSFPSKKEKK
jgi:hypothetical protein